MEKLVKFLGFDPVIIGGEVYYSGASDGYVKFEPRKFEKEIEIKFEMNTIRMVNPNYWLAKVNLPFVSAEGKGITPAKARLAAALNYLEKI